VAGCDSAQAWMLGWIQAQVCAGRQAGIQAEITTRLSQARPSLAGPTILQIITKFVKQRENHEKSCFSWFFQEFFSQNPFQNLQKTCPIILNRSQPPPTLPEPFYIDFILFNLFSKKNACFF